MRKRASAWVGGLPVITRATAALALIVFIAGWLALGNVPWALIAVLAGGSLYSYTEFAKVPLSFSQRKADLFLCILGVLRNWEEWSPVPQEDQRIPHPGDPFPMHYDKARSEFIGKLLGYQDEINLLCGGRVISAYRGILSTVKYLDTKWYLSGGRPKNVPSKDEYRNASTVLLNEMRRELGFHLYGDILGVRFVARDDVGSA